MIKNNNRIVYRNEQGKWVNKKTGNTKGTSLHLTQKEVIGDSLLNRSRKMEVES